MPRPSHPLPTILLVTLLAAAFAAAFCSELPVRALMVGNSDTLLAAAYAQNLLHHPATLASFQFSRLPSFVPDLALYTALTALLPDWRWAAAAYGTLSYVALVLTAGAVAARMAATTWARGSATLLAVSAIALLLEMATENSAGTLFYIFIPINHSGSVTLSLAGLLLARHIIAHPSRGQAAALVLLAALLLLAAGGMASDKLFFGSFCAPLAAAALAWAAPRLPDQPRWPRARQALLVAGLAAGGCAVGVLLDRVLFTTILIRQLDVAPNLAVNLATHVHRAAAMLSEPNLLASLVLAALALAIPATWRRTPETLFWWAAAAATALGFFALLTALYSDLTAARYIQPVRWWAVIILTAAALRAAPAAAPWAAAALATLAIATVARAQDLFQPAKLFAFRPPLAACLQSWHDRGVIHAGLAQYWDARLLEASTDWRLQIEQVVDAAQVFVWGNNPFYYTHDRLNPSVPPLFDYVVMKDLDPDSVRARLGTPDRVLPCPGSDVWLYTTPGGVGPRIGRLDLAAGKDAILSGPACFGPLDFITPHGPLPPTGLTVDPAAVPHAVATYGPYVRLHAGQWTFRLLYHLTAGQPGPHDWDLAADGGATLLQSGQLRPPTPASAPTPIDIALAVTQTTTPLELRTYLQPGDRLRLDSLAAWPAGTSPPTCPAAAAAGPESPAPSP